MGIKINLNNAINLFLIVSCVIIVLWDFNLKIFVSTVALIVTTRIVTLINKHFKKE